MVGAKTLALYLLAFSSGFWIFTTVLLSPKSGRVETSKAQPFDSLSATVTTITFHDLTSLLDTISQFVTIINLVPSRPNRNSASFSMFESDIHLVLTGELYEKLINSRCKIDSLVATDPRLLQKFKWQSVSQSLTSHIIISCDGKLIILTILVPRHDYYWTAKFNESDYEQFQQPSRAFDKSLVDNLRKQLQGDKRLWKPSNSSLWSWHFQYSRFIECDYENIVWPFRYLFSKFIESHNETLTQSVLKTIRKLSLKNRVPFQIYGGTLLGWYRQCDFIPYSKDVDIIVNETYFAYDLFKDIWNGGEMKIIVRYGRPNDSLELVTIHKPSGMQTDLFTWHYEPGVDNETYVNYYYTKSMKVNRYVYPIIKELCTAELLGVLVYVPCNPELSLDTEYEEGWFQPKRSYVSQNCGFYKKYTNSTWIDLYHYYSKHSCRNPSFMHGCD